MYVSSATQSAKVGELKSTWHNDEPVFLGPQVGAAEGYPTVEAAASRAAAGAKLRYAPDTFAVVQNGDRYVPHELYQARWSNHGGYQTLETFNDAAFEPKVGTDDRRPRFDFRSNTNWGGDARSGRFELDARSGVVAIVGGSSKYAQTHATATWMLRDGVLSDVTPVADPKPEPVPAPEPAPVPAPNRAAALLADVTEALRLAKESARIIETVPVDDRGAAATKDVRIKAYETNLAAQKRIERHFAAGDPAAVESQLRTADAHLEDANWQLAKKPSPDGRFNGVDVPGALRDTATAVDILEQVHAAAVAVSD